MAYPPNTVIAASPEEAEGIRQAVRAVVTVNTPYGNYHPSVPADIDALFQLLNDTRVVGPLYTVPKPATRDWIKQWIKMHQEETSNGTGLLMVARNEVGVTTGFVDVQVWPERASAEFGGAISPELQSTSLGTRGAAVLFDWLFREIGIRLIAMTNALDNVRTEKLLRKLGFRRLVDRVCIAANGDERPSMYWELNREDWHPAIDDPDALKKKTEFQSCESDGL